MHTPNGSRPSRDEYFLTLAKHAATRATCARRQVGYVLVDEKGHVLSTGFNGVCQGESHCIDTPCPGAKQPSGQGLHLCEAIHAEQNALLQCHDIDRIHSAYGTASPCIQCMRLLANTSVKRIVFLEVYPHAESKNLADRCRIGWIHHPM